MSTMRGTVGSVTISPPLFWPRSMGLIPSIEALAGAARTLASMAAGFAHQFPRLSEQIRGPAKTRLSEAGQRLFDRNETGTGAFNHNAQSASHREPLRASDPDTGTLVNEQQISLNPSGQLNRLPFSAIQAHPFVRVRQAFDLPHYNPGGELQGPLTNDGRRPR